MARKDYISDNLINMQSKLKEVYATKSPGSSVSVIAPTAAASSAAPANTVSPGQVKHDLATRLERELTTIGSDLNRQKARIDELETYKTFLEETIANIDQLDQDSADFRRSLDNMRMEFFRQSGRINSINPNESAAQTASGSILSDKHCYILAGAIGGAALIVAVTLIVLFA